MIVSLCFFNSTFVVITNKLYYLCIQIHIKQIMKKILYGIFSFFVAIVALTSCDDGETYAEQKEEEEKAINSYIKANDITVISESKFHEQGDSTSVENNEYVLFSSSGVYMQIVDKGCGEVLQKGEIKDVLVRFEEYNINYGYTQLYNNTNYFASVVDKMTVVNTSGTFSATFISGLMMDYYGSSQVPSGWLVPLTYVNLGRIMSEDDQLAHVKVIVPHDQGHAYASSGVYACHYDLTYQLAANEE